MASLFTFVEYCFGLFDSSGARCSCSVRSVICSCVGVEIEMQVALREGTGRHCQKWDAPQTPKTAKPTLVKLLNFSRKGVSTREKERGRASHERAGGKRAGQGDRRTSDHWDVRTSLNFIVFPTSDRTVELCCAVVPPLQTLAVKTSALTHQHDATSE